jgi:hypothetical protein
VRRLAHPIVNHPWLVLLAWLVFGAAILVAGPSFGSVKQTGISLAVRTVNAGKALLEPEVQRRLIQLGRAGGPPEPAAAPQAAPAPRRADAAGGGRPGPDRPRPVQPGDRRAPVRERGHGEDPHQQAVTYAYRHGLVR